MHELINGAIETCGWYESSYYIFSENVFAPLIYYSHLGVIVPLIFISLFIFFSNRNATQSKLLVLMTASLVGWIYSDLVLWASERPDLVMFFWSIEILLEPLVYFFAFYFIYNFASDRDFSLKQKMLFTLPLLPTFILAPTELGLLNFDLSNCDRAATEGFLPLYGYIIELVYVVLTCIYAIKFYRGSTDNIKKKRIKLVTIGIVLFLISFSLGNITEVFTENWQIGQFGLFGSVIFASFLAYAVVKYKAFNVKLVTVQVLISAVWFLLFAILFIRTIENVRMVVILSLVMVGILGYLTIKAVLREIKQREEIQKLAVDLQRANDRLKELDKTKSEFVSIASHQLRSPITAIAGYAALIREGDYGEVSAKLKEPLERIEQSARMMATSIEDYLNVSRIESGNMKYNYSDFNLKDEAEHICDDLRPVALKQGLVLLFKQSLTGQGVVKADIGKVQQIIHNLINNSIKYTPKGAITVFVHDDASAKKIYVDIMDTGIGMSEATLGSIFGKFSRADNANSVNVKGTGLGLYVALKMAEAMGGTITAHSEGEGKGSKFSFELKLH